VRGGGLSVAVQPPFEPDSPHLNPVETIWRRVKGFLMPRRHYRSVEELREAVVAAMERLREQLGHGVLQSLCIGT
jgi:putative transposase